MMSDQSDEEYFVLDAVGQDEFSDDDASKVNETKNDDATKDISSKDISSKDNSSKDNATNRHDEDTSMDVQQHSQEASGRKMNHRKPESRPHTPTLVQKEGKKKKKRKNQTNPPHATRRVVHPRGGQSHRPPATGKKNEGTLSMPKQHFLSNQSSEETHLMTQIQSLLTLMEAKAKGDDTEETFSTMISDLKALNLTLYHERWRYLNSSDVPPLHYLHLKCIHPTIESLLTHETVTTEPSTASRNQILHFEDITYNLRHMFVRPPVPSLPKLQVPKHVSPGNNPTLRMFLAKEFRESQKGNNRTDKDPSNLQPTSRNAATLQSSANNQLVSQFEIQPMQDQILRNTGPDHFSPMHGILEQLMRNQGPDNLSQIQGILAQLMRNPGPDHFSQIQGILEQLMRNLGLDNLSQIQGVLEQLMRSQGTDHFSQLQGILEQLMRNQGPDHLSPMQGVLEQLLRNQGPDHLSPMQGVLEQLLRNQGPDHFSPIQGVLEQLMRNQGPGNLSQIQTVLEQLMRNQGPNNLSQIQTILEQLMRNQGPDNLSQIQGVLEQVMRNQGPDHLSPIQGVPEQPVRKPAHERLGAKKSVYDRLSDEKFPTQQEQESPSVDEQLYYEAISHAVIVNAHLPPLHSKKMLEIKALEESKQNILQNKLRPKTCEASQTIVPEPTKVETLLDEQNIDRFPSSNLSLSLDLEPIPIDQSDAIRFEHETKKDLRQTVDPSTVRQDVLMTIQSNESQKMQNNQTNSNRISFTAPLHCESDFHQIESQHRQQQQQKHHQQQKQHQQQQKKQQLENENHFADQNRNIPPCEDPNIRSTNFQRRPSNDVSLTSNENNRSEIRSNQREETSRCVCCLSPHHSLSICPKFVGMRLTERWNLINDSKPIICSICLDVGHLSRHCQKSANRCCNQRYHKLLHLCSDQHQPLKVDGMILSSEPANPTCLCCMKVRHDLKDCHKFINMDRQRRLAAISRSKVPVCQICLSYFHLTQDCRDSFQCQLSKACQVKTHPLLHLCQKTRPKDKRRDHVSPIRTESKTTSQSAGKRPLEDGGMGHRPIGKERRFQSPSNENERYRKIEKKMYTFFESQQDQSKVLLARMLEEEKAKLRMTEEEVKKKQEIEKSGFNSPLPEWLKVCSVCQSEYHDTNDCPKNFCTKCQKFGHQISDCNHHFQTAEPRNTYDRQHQKQQQQQQHQHNQQQQQSKSMPQPPVISNHFEFQQQRKSQPSYGSQPVTINQSPSHSQPNTGAKVHSGLLWNHLARRLQAGGKDPEIANQMMSFWESAGQSELSLNNLVSRFCPESRQMLRRLLVAELVKAPTTGYPKGFSVDHLLDETIAFFMPEHLEESVSGRITSLEPLHHYVASKMRTMASRFGIDEDYISQVATSITEGVAKSGFGLEGLERFYRSNGEDSLASTLDERFDSISLKLPRGVTPHHAVTMIIHFVSRSKF